MKFQEIKVINEDLERPVKIPFLKGELVYFAHQCPDQKAVNGDCVGVFQDSSTAGVIALADGAGGTPGGNKASGVCVETFLDELNQKKLALRERIINGFEISNKKLLEQRTGSLSTLFAVEIDGNEVRSYHAGDSMILVCGGKGLIKLKTLSHSPAGHAKEAGMIQDEAELPIEERQVVTNLVGISGMRIEVGSSLELTQKDTVLICSDGITDNLSIDAVCEIIRKGELEDCAMKLIEATLSVMNDTQNQNSKPDDYSFVLYRGRT